MARPVLKCRKLLLAATIEPSLILSKRQNAFVIVLADVSNSFISETVNERT